MSFETNANSPNQPPATSIGALFSRFSDQISALFRGEIELAKAEATAKVKKLGIGGVLFAVAGVLALYGLGMLFFAAAWAFALIMPMWAATLTVSLLIFLICVILALVGKAKISASQKHQIDVKQGLKDSVDAVKKGITS